MFAPLSKEKNFLKISDVRNMEVVRSVTMLPERNIKWDAYVIFNFLVATLER